MKKMTRNQPSARREKRAAKRAELKSKRGKAISDEQQKPPMSDTERRMQILFMRLQELDNRTRQLMEVSSTNMRDLNIALGMQDAHLWVLRRLSSDIVAGTVKYTESYIKQREAGVNGTIEDPIDFTWYYQQFDAWLQQQQLLAQQAEQQTAAEEGPEEFGGDYGESEDGSEEDGDGPTATEDLGERGSEENEVSSLPLSSGPE